jgi:hypothetical protein
MTEAMFQKQTSSITFPLFGASKPGIPGMAHLLHYYYYPYLDTFELLGMPPLSPIIVHIHIYIIIK